MNHGTSNWYSNEKSNWYLNEKFDLKQYPLVWEKNEKIKVSFVIFIILNDLN